MEKIMFALLLKVMGNTDGKLISKIVE